MAIAQQTPPDSALAKECEALSHGARLHWFHWLILVLSGLLAVFAWYFSSAQIREKAQIQFDREATQVVELVSERMTKYEDALWAGVAALQSNGGSMSYDEWRTFADSLHIDTKYPGINGIGVILHVAPNRIEQHVAEQRTRRPHYRVHPHHNEAERLPIVYIEPEAPNAKAVGLDVAHESNRYLAARRARDSGAAQITGPIVLVQDEGRTPGFLFYVPFYKSGQHADIAQRQENFAGMIYAPFVVNRLLAGTLEKTRRHVGIRLVDGQDVLYDEHTVTEPDYDPNPLFSRQFTVDVYGREWVFDIRSSQSFRDNAASNQPEIILAAGIVIDLLLLTLFVAMTRANRKTLEFAGRMTDALQDKATALEKSNGELESFAYVASHDLKTPLRGISDLVSYLEEDIAVYADNAGEDPGLQHNIGRIKQQIQRMENLIRGILDYSGVGVRSETIELINVSKVLDRMRRDLNIREEQLVAVSPLPIIQSYRTRFLQVLDNLVGNAFKYHHDRDNAIVEVSCTEHSDGYEFRVSDNGPGIERKFHARIFEVFQTLQSRDEIESTGVGLSIVKKSIEGLGGTISVESSLGSGTTFAFFWPKAFDHAVDQTRKAS